MKTVNLLGRGPSLKCFNEIPNAEIVVLANDFDREISQIPEFRDYLTKQTIQMNIDMSEHFHPPTPVGEFVAPSMSLQSNLPAINKILYNLFFNTGTVAFLEI